MQLVALNGRPQALHVLRRPAHQPHPHGLGQLRIDPAPFSQCRQQWLYASRAVDMPCVQYRQRAVSLGRRADTVAPSPQILESLGVESVRNRYDVLSVPLRIAVEEVL